MSRSVDFKIISRGEFESVLVMSYNEQAYNYLTSDCPVTPVSGGYVEMSHEDAGDLESDAAWAGLECEYA